MLTTKGLALIINSTLASGGCTNGGNLNSGGETDLTNTILAYPAPINSLGVTGGNCTVSGTGFVIAIGSLQDGSSPLCLSKLGSIPSGDPLLLGLQNNGGPTLTMAIPLSSPAIGKADAPWCPATDQRGVLRPVGPHCDVGAYEHNTGQSTPGAIRFRLLAFVRDLASENAATRVTNRVIVPLTNALDPSLWLGTDGNHLNPQGGSHVFNLFETAVNNLSALIVDQTQVTYIKNVVTSGRLLASTAMSDAGCSLPGTPPPQPCAKAASELANGDASASAGRYGEALDHYQRAWEAVVSPGGATMLGRYTSEFR
jgi:hypothetical protein